MPDEIDAEVLEVFGGQLRQDNHINGVVAKRLLVLLQPKTVKPRSDVQPCLPEGFTARGLPYTKIATRGVESA